MAIRIRLYPQTMGGAYGAFGAYGRMGAVSAQTYYTQKLQTQQQISNLRLGYERALWSEKLDKVRLEERLKNPYALGYAGGIMPMYNPMTAYLGQSLLSGASMFNGLGLGRLF